MLSAILKKHEVSPKLELEKVTQMVFIYAQIFSTAHFVIQKSIISGEMFQSTAE